MAKDFASSVKFFNKKNSCFERAENGAGKAVKYSEKVARLEEILADMERGSVPSARDRELCREGEALVAECRGFLVRAEGAIKKRSGEAHGGGSSAAGEDSRLEEAVKIVLGTGVASCSALQRQMRIGFMRAARMIAAMEAMGIVGPQNGAEPREILVDEAGARKRLDGRCGA